MDVAQGSLQQLLYGEETVFGVSPSDLVELPMKDGVSLGLQKETFRSEVVRPDRQGGKIRHGTRSAAGDIPFELIFGDFDTLLEGALFGDWATTSTTTTASTISASQATNALTNSAGWAGFATGDWVEVSGTTDGSNDGVAEVVSVVSNVMTLAHMVLVDETAGESITVDKRDILSNGIATHFYSFERGFIDIGNYLLFSGCMINALSLSIPPSGLVTGSFSVVGADMATSATSQDASPDAASLNVPFAGIDCTSVYEGGAEASQVTSLDFKLENGAEAKFRLGSPSVDHISFGSCKVSGSATMYFTDLGLLDKFVDETETSLQMTLVDPDDNVLTIDLHSIKYSTGEPQTSGAGSASVKMDFEAQVDDVTGKTLTFSRTATG